MSLRVAGEPDPEIEPDREGHREDAVDEERARAAHTHAQKLDGLWGRVIGRPADPDAREDRPIGGAQDHRAAR
jgi:hypothetical protein